MSFQITTYSVSKYGHDYSENQDSAWPRIPQLDADAPLVSKAWTYKNKDLSESGLIVAVSDGASEGLFSGRWAKVVASRASMNRRTNSGKVRLDEAYVRCWVDRSLKVWQRFMLQRSSRALHKDIPVTNLPSWLEEPAIERGGFATLAALQLKKRGEWAAIAIGDSCIFRVRKNEFFSFPIENLEDFENHPHLLSSVRGLGEDTSEDTSKQIKTRRSGNKKTRWKTGDSFYIMTDAIACCFLKKAKNGDKPWKTIRDIGSKEASNKFDELIQRWRIEGEINNDDVTLIQVEII